MSSSLFRHNHQSLFQSSFKVPELLDDLLLPVGPLLGGLLVVDRVAVVLGDEVPRLDDGLVQGQSLVGWVCVHLVCLNQITAVVEKYCRN